MLNHFQESMYLGIENPNGYPNKYLYKGQIFEHAVYNRKFSKKEVNAKARAIYIKDAEAATKKAVDKIKLKNYMATAPRTNLKTGGLVVNPARMRNR